jgi:hypothetical protein
MENWTKDDPTSVTFRLTVGTDNYVLTIGQSGTPPTRTIAITKNGAALGGSISGLPDLAFVKQMMTQVGALL